MFKKYYFFIGTTAELIKIFPVISQAAKQGVDYEVIASGQNDISQNPLFGVFNLKKPSITLSTTKIRQKAIWLLIWWFKIFIKGMLKLPKLLAKDRKESVMFVHGDTISTVMGALLARWCGMKVAHIEAGLRSFNYFSPFPEEIDRVITSRLVHYHFCPNDWAMNNLKKLKAIKINTGQNTLAESLDMVRNVPGTPEVLKQVAGKNYFVFVMHRQENLFQPELVKCMIDKVTSKCKDGERCIFILHAPTKQVLESLGLLEQITECPNLYSVPRLEYIDFMKVLGGCDYLITDGGSNQEEAYYMGLPCLVLREHTERIEGLDHNVLMHGHRRDVLDKFLSDPSEYQREPVTIDIKPAQIIMEGLSKK